MTPLGSLDADGLLHCMQWQNKMVKEKKQKEWCLPGIDGLSGERLLVGESRRHSPTVPFLFG